MINSKLNKNLNVVVIYLDFQKAFDTLSHSLIIKALDRIGVTQKTKKWFINYLSNRSLIVKIFNDFGEKVEVKSGIPQGSNLGPLLYLIQVISLNETVKNAEMFNFADDTAIIFAHSKVQNAEEIIQKDFDLVQRWVHDHSLTLNVKKTTCMHITPPFQNEYKLNLIVHTNSCLHELDVNEKCKCSTKLQQVSEQKYLGVIIDRQLKWGPHINYVCNRLRSCTYGLYHLCKVIKRKKALITIYKAFAESIVRYGLVAWGSAITYNLKRVAKLQLALLRIIHNKKESFPKPDLFKLYNVLPVEELYKEIIFTMYYFDDTYKNNTIRMHESRNNASYKRYIEPRYFNNYGKRELRYLVPTTFNTVPDQLIGLKKIGHVKTKIRDYLNEQLPDTL